MSDKLQLVIYKQLYQLLVDFGNMNSFKRYLLLGKIKDEIEELEKKINKGVKK